VHNPLDDSRVRMRNRIASAFWKWRRRRSPGQGQAPAWTTWPNRSVSERGLCIATALLEAVYRTEVEKLAAAERKPAQGMLPIEALRSRMLLFPRSDCRSDSLGERAIESGDTHRSSLGGLWNDLGSYACLHHRNRRLGTTSKELLGKSVRHAASCSIGTSW
jgi:hypothetical protein